MAGTVLSFSDIQSPLLADPDDAILISYSAKVPNL